MKLNELSATELDNLYTRKEISPVEVVRNCFERHDETHAEINAICYLDREGAIQTARASEARMLAGQRVGPLDGVPCTVKDNLFVRGLPATWGSKLYAAFVPDRDDIVVERIRAGGLCILGKSNTPEFALSGRTDNLLFGPTRHPLNPLLTPGGSSGGAVASTLARVAPLAIATDAGGSTRLPASYTGLYGFRPSTGRIPRCHGFPPLAHDFQVIGLISRSLSDLRRLWRLTSGPDERDRSSAVQPQGPGVPWQVRSVGSVGDEPVDEEVSTCFREVVAALEQAEIRIHRGPAPYDLQSVRAVWSTLSSVGVARVATSFPNWREMVTPDILKTVETGIQFSGQEYVRALDVLATMRTATADLFGDDDFVITPTAAVQPWSVTEPHVKEVSGRPGTPRSASIFSTWVNACGLPAISLPLGRTKAGMPVGIQLVGRYGHDERLLEMAKRLLDVAAPVS